MKEAIIIITGKVNGIIIMKDTKKGLQIKIDLKNIKEGYHGFHIHNYGNMLNGCETLGGHYNPEKQNHGSLTSKIRHKGDLGNIKANSNNTCKKTIYVKDLVINELLGRSIVIHDKKDDLGKGLNHESKKTGNAGKRIGCGIIALMSE
jgi:Cu-Zn family superoxide dismutase